jgi:hypothetical protein
MSLDERSRRRDDKSGERVAERPQIRPPGQVDADPQPVDPHVIERPIVIATM